MAANSEVGVTVTLREIYDATMMSARTADGARDDIAALRKDVQDLRRRVGSVEDQLKETGSPAYLRKAAYVLGGAAAAVVAGYTAVKGGG